MKKREKILAGVVFGMLGIFVLGFGIRGFFVQPLKKIDQDISILREKIGKINQERREYFAAEDQLKKVAQRTFGSELNQASGRSGEFITRRIADAGLSEADFTRLPVGPRRLRGASEIGWSIQGKGDLQRIVDFLFLLESAPQVHRLESVTISSYDRPGEIKVRFLFLTLVLDPTPEFDPVELKTKVSLEGAERLAYSPITERDLLRPYIKAPPPPPAPEPAKTQAPPGPETLRVVSLSEWEGQPEVHIRDTARNETLRFKPGDTLKNGATVVGIDYRPVPLPRNPLLMSHSRLILKIGADYWAVERGQTLADKRKLDEGQWPVQ